MWFSVTLSTAFVLCIIYISTFASNPVTAEYSKDGLHVPCQFSETVNITSDLKYPNGSYLHDGIVIPPKYVGIYDYIYVSERRIDVAPHIRGCVCKLRTCINICCHWEGAMWEDENRTCVETDFNRTDFNTNITLFDESVSSVNIYDKYAVVTYRPCGIMYELDLIEERWTIYENGSISFSNLTRDSSEMCFFPHRLNGTDGVTLVPAVCASVDVPTVMGKVNAIAMMFSIPFMVLTILVYLIVPELRNQHGKSLISYLFGLIVGYSFLSYMVMAGIEETYGLKCKLIGYTTYYFFMSAFFWLNVISFDLWHNFRGTRGINRFQEKKRFIIYCLYSWGLAAIFLLITWTAQEHLDIDESLKPGIAGGQYCWLNMRSWAALIYFFAPIIIIITCNTAMFVMTAIKIHRVQKEMAKIMAKEDSTKNLRTERDRFGLFLRLFFIMGVTWTVEIISYLVGSESPWSQLFYITDICNGIQGFLIFMLFVMKKKIKDLITHRFSRMCGKTNQRQSQYSSRTTTSSIGNLATNSSEKPLILTLKEAPFANK